MSRTERERALGIVATPPDLVAFMVALAAPPRARVRVLEPACGDAPFLAAFAARYGSHHELVGVDIDPMAVERARRRLSTAIILEEDFLLWEPSEPFDLIIGNPPYGIIGDASHYPIHGLKERKHLYKQRSQTWRGKYNIYGAFIEHAVRLLQPAGRLVFVVPSTWLVLDDFARLRQFLAREGHLEIYYAGRPFADRNVVAVVLVLDRGGQGFSLYEWSPESNVRGPMVRKAIYRGEWIRFETPETLAFEREGVPLGELMDIYFAARSPEIRRHPSVSGEPRPGLVPVLTGRNLKPGWIDYETCYSGLWMPREEAPLLRFFYAFPHIVVGHTKGARVVAARDERCYPWREEFHLVPKVPGLDEEQLVRYLNSAPVQGYVRTLYRDLTPHLTMTQLRRLPISLALPPTISRPQQLRLWEKIVENHKGHKEHEEQKAFVPFVHPL
ncbi:MAG: TaqI-like C-terminal specificity domain-containing protein [Anaerolineae bacterium]|nr:Eco57I restriction-modification methylase domain-containing protein [Anaerolineae bacterium]MDW8069025.1 TaqI-like C-terminal specificity domain-containing protein [Anaerolineae bacterium]